MQSQLARDVIKSVVWRIVSIIALAVISLGFGAPLILTGKINITYHFITFILFILHEKWWAKLGKKDA